MRASTAGLVAISVIMLIVVLTLLGSSAKAKHDKTEAACNALLVDLSERSRAELALAQDARLTVPRRFAAAHRAAALGSAAGKKKFVDSAGQLLTQWSG